MDEQKLQLLLLIKSILSDVLRLGQQIDQLHQAAQMTLAHAGEELERCTQLIDELTKAERKQ